MPDRDLGRSGRRGSIGCTSVGTGDRHMYRAWGGEVLEFWWKWICGPGLALVLGLVVLQGVPAWSAHPGHGRPGTWTVTRIACAKKGCTPLGDFTAEDGRGVRRDIRLIGGDRAVIVGERLAAVDAG